MKIAELVIRDATAADFKAWSEMRVALWPESSAAEHLNELKQVFSATPLNDEHGWVALEGRKYIGFAEAAIRPYANGCDSRPVAFLEGIWVKETHRKEHVGRRLLTAVEAWALAKGIHELGSDAQLANELSHLCHRKWGFEETERVVYFRKKLAQ